MKAGASRIVYVLLSLLFLFICVCSEGDIVKASAERLSPASCLWRPHARALYSARFFLVIFLHFWRTTMADAPLGPRTSAARTWSAHFAKKQAARSPNCSFVAFRAMRARCSFVRACTRSSSLWSFSSLPGGVHGVRVSVKGGLLKEGERETTRGLVCSCGRKNQIVCILAPLWSSFLLRPPVPTFRIWLK